jgi:hypothetical protein
MLAIKSGFRASRAVLVAERAGGPLTQKAQERYTEEVGKMCKVFLNMIKMFYDNRAFEVFMTPCPSAEMERAINNLVAGNTNLGWKLRLRVWLFYAICAIQKRFALAPRLDFSMPPVEVPAGRA